MWWYALTRGIVVLVASAKFEGSGLLVLWRGVFLFLPLNWGRVVGTHFLDYVGTIKNFEKNWTYLFWEVPYFSKGMYWIFNDMYDKDMSDVCLSCHSSLWSHSWLTYWRIGQQLTATYCNLWCPLGDGRGTAVAQWLSCCATNQKVAGSIPDGVVGIFYWHNPSDHTMALRLTKPLTEMSIRSICWG